MDAMVATAVELELTERKMGHEIPWLRAMSRERLLPVGCCFLGNRNL
jgi:hypothetical protein